MKQVKQIFKTMIIVMYIVVAIAGLVFCSQMSKNNEDSTKLMKYMEYDDFFINENENVLAANK